jgi:hypothetical protein
VNFQDYLNAINAYRGFNPDGWIAIYRYLPTWLGLLILVIGALLLPFGGGQRTWRFVAAPIGALVGFLIAPALAQAFGLLLDPVAVAAVGAFALFIGGALFPPVVGFFAAGVPVALLAGRVAGNGDFLMGFIPVLLLVGTGAALAVRPLSAIVSALLGAWFVLIGTFATFHRNAFIPEFAAHPWYVLTVASLFTLAGAGYQLALRPTPEQVAKEKAERAKARREEAERAALEERWSNYSEKNKKKS